MIGWLVVVSFLAPLASPAQQVSIPSPGPRNSSSKKRTNPELTSNLRVGTSLVQALVTVTDKLGRPVGGLEKENFRLFDNKLEQTIVHFASDDESVAVGFVFDVSGSIGGEDAPMTGWPPTKFSRSQNRKMSFFR